MPIFKILKRKWAAVVFKLSLVKAKEEERRENEILLTAHARTAQAKSSFSQVKPDSHQN